MSYRACFKTFKLNDDAKMHDVPENCMIRKHKDSKRRIQEKNCRSDVDMMSCLASTTCTDILFAVC